MHFRRSMWLSMRPAVLLSWTTNFLKGHSHRKQPILVRVYSLLATCIIYDNLLHCKKRLLLRKSEQQRIGVTFYSCSGQGHALQTVFVGIKFWLWRISTPSERLYGKAEQDCKLIYKTSFTCIKMYARHALESLLHISARHGWHH
jgi:hypothetical protein